MAEIEVIGVHTFSVPTHLAEGIVEVLRANGHTVKIKRF